MHEKLNKVSKAKLTSKMNKNEINTHTNTSWSTLFIQYFRILSETFNSFSENIWNNKKNTKKQHQKTNDKERINNQIDKVIYFNKI